MSSVQLSIVLFVVVHDEVHQLKRSGVATLQDKGWAVGRTSRIEHGSGVSLGQVMRSLRSGRRQGKRCCRVVTGLQVHCPCGCCVAVLRGWACHDRPTHGVTVGWQQGTVTP